MVIETIINTTKEVSVNIANHLPNDTINVGVQLPLDNWGFFTAIFTGLLVVATLFMTYVTNKNTTKTTNLVRLDISSRIRPILQFVDSKIEIVKFAPDDESLRIIGKIKNSGQAPARKIRMFVYETNNDKIENLIKEKKDIQKEENVMGTIQQGGYADFYKILPWYGYERIRNLAIWFKFSFLDNIQDEGLLVIRLEPDKEPAIHKWFVKEDVEEAEKQEKDFRDGKIHSP